jgi:hypothetical protein
VKQFLSGNQPSPETINSGTQNIMVVVGKWDIATHIYVAGSTFVDETFNAAGLSASPNDVFELTFATPFSLSASALEAGQAFVFELWWKTVNDNHTLTFVKDNTSSNRK